MGACIFVISGLSLRVGRIPGHLHCAAGNGLALACEAPFSDSRDFGLCYCTLSAAGETKHSAQRFLLEASLVLLQSLLENSSSSLLSFPSQCVLVIPKQNRRLSHHQHLLWPWFFMVPAGTAGVSLLKYCPPSPPHQLAGSHISREWEVGRACACEEANIPLSNLYFTFL